MRFLLNVVFLMTIIGCQPKHNLDPVARVIPVETFATEIQQEDVQLVDVRTPEEYGEGHIEGAINIDVKKLNAFKSQIQSLDKNEPVYIYCRSGRRSRLASEILKDEGFEQVVDLEGGYLQWTQTTD